MSSPFAFIPLADPRDEEAFRPLGTAVPAPTPADPAAARAVEEAFERGRVLGRDEGLALVIPERDALRGCRALLEEAVAALGTLHGQVVAHADGACLGLAIAGRILQTEWNDTRAAVTGDELARWLGYADALAKQALQADGKCQRLEAEARHLDDLVSREERRNA